MTYESLKQRKQPAYSYGRLARWMRSGRVGGALPLEAQRLGLESYASNPNPVNARQGCLLGDVNPSPVGSYLQDGSPWTFLYEALVPTWGACDATQRVVMT